MVEMCRNGEMCAEGVSKIRKNHIDWRGYGKSDGTERGIQFCAKYGC
jgi:hypothetical protein